MTDHDWPQTQFAQLKQLEELVLVVSREGHDTARVPVWVVTIDGDVYVRSYKGVTSMWFRRVQAKADQAIQLAEGDVAVHFENVARHDAINHEIDAAFTQKYAKYDYVDAMSAPAAVDATLRIRPRA